MKLSNNKGDKMPTWHLWSPNELFSTGNGLHLTELLVKLTPKHGNSQTIQAITKTIGCSPQTYVMFYCWRQHLHNSLNTEKPYILWILVLGILCIKCVCLHLSFLFFSQFFFYFFVLFHFDLFTFVLCYFIYFIIIS